MQIKEASKEDIKAVAKVYVDSWKTTYRGLVPAPYLEALSYVKAEKKWKDFHKDNESFIYVATNNEREIVGFASGKHINDKQFEGELYALYLAEEYRGSGNGRQLVAAIAKHFQKKGITSLLVWVMEQNKPGVRFYKRLGGTQYLRRKNEFGGQSVDDIALGWSDITELCL